MVVKFFAAVVTYAAIAVLGWGPAHAQAAGAEALTLRKILESGVVSIGYRDGSVPFSYLDEHQRPVGYSLDICLRVVDAIQQRLLPRRIEVRWVPVTPATRIPLVVNGTIDLECGVTTNTLERQKQVAFTVTTFVTRGKMMWKRSSGFASIADLRGRAIVSTVGTTNIQQLDVFNNQSAMDWKIIAARDDAQAFRMVQADRASAYAMDDVLLKSAIVGSSDPAEFVISDDALSVEPYAIALRRNDPEFKRLADDAIVALFRHGEINRIYRRWFQSPVPPRGINLQMPMSAALERVIATPTDRGDPGAYR